jgi:signal peptidase I
MSEGLQVADRQRAEVPVNQPARRNVHKGAGFLASVQSLTTTVVIAVFVITFIVQAFQIPSESMENTLLIGDYLLVDKVHYGKGGIWREVEPYSPVRRGDIIVFRYPINPAQHFVKRVIGLPGDRIHLQNKRVFVNGQPLREPYVVYRDKTIDPYRDDFPNLDYPNINVDGRWWVKLRALTHNGEIVVPPNSYFVLGDNRDQSLDSRYWGFVPSENIIGRPLVIYWSMRHPERLEPVASDSNTISDRVIRFTYIIAHAFQETRWHRTLRLIK